jgi:hypothetical protein
MESIRIDALAYHEAGHAFVAMMMKKMRVIKVFYDCGTEGYTTVQWISGDINFEKLCFYLAGEITEYEFSEQFSERHAGIDRKITEDILFLISGKRSEQYEVWMRAIRTVQALINDPKNAKKIQRIAAELMMRGTLSEEELCAIIKEE